MIKRGLITLELATLQLYWKGASEEPIQDCTGGLRRLVTYALVVIGYVLKTFHFSITGFYGIIVHGVNKKLSSILEWF